MTTTTVEVVADTRDLAALEKPWLELVADRQLPGPFCNYPWQFEWWRALGSGRGLRTFVARRGDEVVGILPTFDETENGARFLCLTGSKGGGGDYLTAPAKDADAEKALVSAALSSGVDVLEFEDVEWTSSLRAAIVSAAAERALPVRIAPRYACPFIRLADGFPALLAASGRRDNLRRRRKWLDAQPGYRIECETSPDAVAPFLERFCRLHAARWAADGGSQAFSDERLLGFHRRMAYRMAQAGELRLWTMYVASEAVAVAWTFDDGGRALYYQSGFLPAWGKRSVGLVLFARFVEDACERGLREVDLLRGSEPYKFEWTREGRLTTSVSVVASSRGRRALALRALRRSARTRAGTLLPTRLRRSLSKVVREARMRGAA